MEEPHFIKCESVPESSPNLADAVLTFLSLEPHRKDIYFIDKLHGKGMSIKVPNHVTSIEWNTEELPPVSVEKLKVEPDLAFTDECTEEHSLGIVKEELDIQDNFEFGSGTKPLKQETKPELAEGPTQKNTFHSSADINKEISREQHPVEELDLHIKEENNVGNFAVLTVQTGKEARPGTVRVQASLHKLNGKKHISTPSAEWSYRCNECNRSFARAAGLRSHMFAHSGGTPRNCKQCSSSFTRRSRNVHKLSHSDARLYRCKECNRSFARKNSLKSHMIIHSRARSHSCMECNKSFSDRKRLRSHVLIHSRARPYHCNECNKSFTHGAALRIHMYTHSGERPYFCKVCNSSFTQSGSLKAHMVTHSGARPFVCKECNQSFRQRAGLRSHLFAHSGIRPYRCKVCNYSFTQKSALNVHMFTHSGVSPFRCDECNRSFTWKKDLRVHMFTHSGETPVSL